MNRFIRNAIGTALVMTLGLSLGGCMLLPGEDEAHKISVVTNDISEQYDLSLVDYRDVVLTDVINCTYSQLSEESLSFKTEGRTVSFLYVAEGDSVSKGQLLAKLNVSDLENDILKKQNDIEQYELSIKSQEELIDFYNERLESGTSLLDKENYRHKIITCTETIRDLRSKIGTAESRIAYDNRVISDSQIISPIDGSVSYIKDDLVGSVSSKSIRVITVIDSTVCAFQANDKEAAGYMELGTPVVIVTQDGVSENATLVSADREEGKVVFELDEPDYSLSVGTRGTIRLVRESRSGVLSVPTLALSRTEDFDYVFMLNENGVREMVEVKAGLVGDSYAEIIEGLKPNESVILRKTRK